MVVFGFYELLTTKTIVKTKNDHQHSILRDSLKMVAVFGFAWFFTVVSVVFSCILAVFLHFCSRSGGSYFETIVTRKTMNSVFSIGLRIMFLLCWLLQVFVVRA